MKVTKMKYVPFNRRISAPSGMATNEGTRKLSSISIGRLVTPQLEAAIAVA